MRIIAGTGHVDRPDEHGVLVYNRQNDGCIVTLNDKLPRRESGFAATVEKLRQEGWRVVNDEDLSTYFGEVCLLFRGGSGPTGR